MKHDQLRAVIISQIMQDNFALEEALLLIYHRQTIDEQRAGTTTHQNGVGFNGCDASQASYCAKWLLDYTGKRDPHRHLTGKFLVWAKRVMPKYAGQLATLTQEAIDEAKRGALAKEAAYLTEERIGIQNN